MARQSVPLEEVTMEQYPDFVTTCGYGSVTGILGANCRHSFYPFIPGVMERTYTDEQLENIDPPPFKYEGKEYTHYEATQKQREIERTIRKWKRREAAAATPEDKQAAQIRIRRLKKQYKEFSQAAHLREQPERMKAYVPKNAKAPQQTFQSVVTRAAKSQPQQIVTNTPKTQTNPRYGSVDVTKQWYDTAKPNSHTIEDANSFIQDGVQYTVDGKNVKFEYGAREKEVAQLLEKEFGGKLYMMPKVQGIYKNVKTPDYLYRGERYDLKGIKSSKSDAVHNAIHKKRLQADSFVIDYAPSGITEQEARTQAAAIFDFKSTAFVKRIVLIDGNRIVCVLERK